MKIVIIGGGIAGLSIGWRLARSGCHVVVLERAQPAHAATWASAGMIAATVENIHGGKKIVQFGRHAAGLWPQFAAEIERESGRSIAYRRDGALVAVPSPVALQNLAEIVSGNVRVLSAAETLQLEPMIRHDIAGALFAPDDAQVDNRAVGLALATVFVAAGGTLKAHEAAVRFERSASRILGVRTPFALYTADAYIIAAGAWSSRIEGLESGLVPDVIPVKGEMLALTPKSDAAMPTRVVWGHDVYVVPRHLQVFVGATVSREGFDTKTTDAAESRLLGRAIELMPSLKDWEVAEHWAGLRPGTADDMPLIGETAMPGLFLATGQFRNGILFAPAIADAVHSLVVEHRIPPEVQMFDPKRFAADAPEPGKRVR